MVESPLVRAALRIFTGAVMVFIYLPLVILAVYAFNASPLGVGRRVDSRWTGSVRRRGVQPFETR